MEKISCVPDIVESAPANANRRVAKTQRRKAEEIFGRNMPKGGRKIEAILHAI